MNPDPLKTEQNMSVITPNPENPFATNWSSDIKSPYVPSVVEASRSYSSSPTQPLTTGEVVAMLSTFKNRLAYEEWYRVSAATQDALGGDKQLAIKLLKEYMPEDKEGEYEQLLSSNFSQITARTLVYLARKHGYTGSEGNRARQAFELVEPIGVGKLAATPVDKSKTLLGDRWLCRGGAAIMIGSTGVGKSSASMQQDILWALGRTAFDIEPTGPMRILTIQAENDIGDLSTMSRGVMEGLGLSKEERDKANLNAQYVQAQGHSGERLVELVAQYLEQYRPDILRLDPLQAYLGGDINSAEAVAGFLRQGLNPLLTEFDCGLILVHHTPKPARASDKNKPDDFSHVGMGSSDIANWARAGLYIESSYDKGVYRFRATKRGGAIGWKNPLGEKEYERWYKHGANNWVWEPCDPSTRKPGQKTYTTDNVLEEVPKSSRDGVLLSELKNQLREKQGMSERVINGLITQLIDEGKLIKKEEEVKKGKSGRKRHILYRDPSYFGSYTDRDGRVRFKTGVDVETPKGVDLLEEV